MQRTGVRLRGETRSLKATGFCLAFGPATVTSVLTRRRAGRRGGHHYIVGTLVEVGRRERAAASLGGLIAGRDPAQAGATAPAQGLNLVAIRY